MNNKQIKATASDVMRILRVRRTLLMSIAYDYSSNYCDNAKVRLDELDWVQKGFEDFFSKGKLAIKLLPCLNCGKDAQDKPAIIWTPDADTESVGICVRCPMCCKRSEVFYTPLVNYSSDLAISQKQAMQFAIEDWNYIN